MNASFWTAADQAESDALVFEFVKAALWHRDHCEECQPGQPWCSRLREAFGALTEWRESRVLLSRAAALREMQTLLERERELAPTAEVDRAA